jgi:hypothetical protein
MSKIDLKHSTILMKDGGSNVIEVNIGEGTLTWSEKRTMEYSLNRGLLDTVREGDQVPVEVKMDLLYDFVTSVSGASNANTTPVDALKKTGGAAGWATSDSTDPCAPYAVDLEVHYDPPCGGEQLEKVVLADYRYEQLDYDLKAGTISTSGKCNITGATVTRLAQTTGTGSAS